MASPQRATAQKLAKAGCPVCAPIGVRAPLGVSGSYWPNPLAESAFHGLAGEYIRMIAPHTEADPAGLLIQLLVVFGSAVGRYAHFLVERTRHHTNLFAILVGETSKGRKGTALDHARHLFAIVDPTWTTDGIVSGMSSGEGLIYAVRDGAEHGDSSAGVANSPSRRPDPGVVDKRLLVVETEFSSPLQTARRDGNTLSPVVRDAWDRGDLRTLTKNSPTRATGAHISILGHITATELRRRLTETEIANGFANRFLYVCVRRARLLPHGGNLDEQDLEKLVDPLRKAIDRAREAGQLLFDPNARQLWEAVYPQLSQGQPGLHGSVTARAEAQTIRLALIYALLDRAPAISQAHLEAALAIWEYCDQSARHIFGDSLGDHVADEILRALQEQGELSRTQIRDHFSRHQPTERISTALTTLHQLGLATPRRATSGGRPAENWIAVPPATKATEATEATRAEPPPLGARPADDVSSLPSLLSHRQAAGIGNNDYLAQVETAFRNGLITESERRRYRIQHLHLQAHNLGYPAAQE